MKIVVGLMLALFGVGLFGFSAYAGNGPDDNFPPVCTNPSNAGGHHTDKGDPGHSGGPGHGTGKDCSPTGSSSNGGGGSSTQAGLGGGAVPTPTTGGGNEAPALLLIVVGASVVGLAGRRVLT